MFQGFEISVPKILMNEKGWWVALCGIVLVKVQKNKKNKNTGNLKQCPVTLSGQGYNIFIAQNHKFALQITKKHYIFLDPLRAQDYNHLVAFCNHFWRQLLIFFNYEHKCNSQIFQPCFCFVFLKPSSYIIWNTRRTHNLVWVCVYGPNYAGCVGQLPHVKAGVNVYNFNDRMKRKLYFWSQKGGNENTMRMLCGNIKQADVSK